VKTVETVASYLRPYREAIHFRQSILVASDTKVITESTAEGCEEMWASR
jgi:hypothetical protein